MWILVKCSSSLTPDEPWGVDQPITTSTFDDLAELAGMCDIQPWATFEGALKEAERLLGTTGLTQWAVSECCTAIVHEPTGEGIVIVPLREAR